MIYRAHLMFPSTDLHKYEKAIASGADAICADLEDSIAPVRKHTALSALIEWLHTHTPTVPFQVRVNPGPNDFNHLEVAGVLDKLSAVVIPKVKTVDDVYYVTEDFPVFVIIEEALGVVNIERIAALPNVKGMIVGRSDMGRALGLTDRIADLTYIRQKLAVTAHAFDIQGLDCCHVVRDEAYIRSTWEESARFGITGGACVHPSQIPIAQAIFTPAPEVQAWCRSALVGESQHAGTPYIASDGGVVGTPHYRAARRILND